MAIAGLLVHTLPEYLEEVEEKISLMADMTTYGIHQNQYIVVVAEVHSGRMEKRVDAIKDIEGVLTIYTTYVTLEDEFSKG